MAVDASPSSQAFAFVSWDGSDGRRSCPLATFGSRAPQVLATRLACADPPRADQPELKNAAELRGAVALVVRGGCTFGHKARLLQRAGAVAMLLANNTREEPLAAFTMGESPEDVEQSAEAVEIPCAMMCLQDVRELFKKFPPSVKHGALVVEILPKTQADRAMEECLKRQKERHDAVQSGGWKAIKSTTSSIIKLLEPQGNGSGVSEDDAASQVQAAEEMGGRAVLVVTQPPPLAFVQWATSASTYEVCFAPLADFSAAEAGASFSGKLVSCDPLIADKSLRNAEELRGAIALLRRGSCSFPEKIERVQRAGAVAAIVGNDDEKDPDAAFVMSVDHIDAANATLPAVMVSRSVFVRLQNETKTTTTRVLCLSGEAADGMLASSGACVSFANLAMPAPSYSSDTKGAEVDDLLFDLHVACRDGDHGACQRIVTQVEGEEAKRELVRKACPLNGLTALHHACAGGNDNIVELLLHLGAEPDVTDWAMQTPLHVACAHNNVECARILLRAEGSTATQVPAALYNVDDKYGGISTMRHIGGGTAMHEAARAGSAECIELLLAANARIDSTEQHDGASNKYVFLGVSANDLEGSTPLHVACTRAHAESALYLVAANADINSKDYCERSPLLLACETANDPAKESSAAKIIEKLISSGAIMEEDTEGKQTVSEVGGGKLLLDRVKSVELRRDFEVLYLRREARRARQSSSRLEQESNAVKEQLHGLASEIATLQGRVAEQDTQGHQLHKLRMQMQTMLQFLTAQQISNGRAPPVLAAATESIVASPLLNTGLSQSTGESEEELALDAALSRDLGKKCLRQGQHGLAEKYFQQSLELLPLPGVQQLLVKITRLRLEGEENKMQDAKHHRVPSNTRPLPLSSATGVKCVIIQQLRDKLHKADAAPQARIMLERELAKLDALSESGSEFALACRWTEWLMALPWGDAGSGLQNDYLYDSKRDVFNQLDELEREQEESHRKQAARTIQRTFRDRYAVHLSTRANAATQIQALVRGRLARQYYESTKQQLLADRARVMSVQLATRHDSIEVAATAGLDYTATIDPTLYRQLQPDCRVVRLIVGQFFAKQQEHLSEHSSVAKEGPKRTFRAVQLVECVLDQTERSRTIMHLAGFDVTQSDSLFFVWTRWGKQPDEKCQCSLGGPYEDQQDAQRRFDRIIRESQNWDNPSVCSPRKEDDGTQSSFEFLRNAAAHGDSQTSIASA